MKHTESDIKLPAVVLAGGKAEPKLAEKYSVEYQAAVPVAGVPMVQRVVNTLADTKHIGEIVVVGAMKCERVTRTFTPGEDIVENMLTGIDYFASNDHKQRILITTSDIPMLTPEAVDDFVMRCMPHEADFFYSIISKEDSSKHFPDMKRTYARLAEGTFTGGNVVIMKADFILGNADLIREVFSARKSIIKLARLIGIATLLRAIIAQVIWAGAINTGRLEETVGRILNARVKVVQTPYPEIGADADNIEQIELARSILEGDLK